MIKIGFIGSGNIANAIINGLLHTELFIKEDIYIYDVDAKKANDINEKYDINISTNNKQLAQEVDIIVLAVKPYIIKDVITEIRDYVSSNHLILSIAAGITIKRMGSLFDKPVKIVRTMPNTPALLNEGMTAITFNNLVTDSDKLVSKNIVESFGKSVVLEEKYFDIYTSMCGSSPAFVYMFIEALSASGIDKGIPKEIAYQIVAQAVLGSAKMVLETNEDPQSLIDKVCTKGGTTIEGVHVLEANNFRNTIKEAAFKTAARSKEISNE